MKEAPEEPVTERRSISQPFRPRARVLQLLGDELTGSARLAIFEKAAPEHAGRAPARGHVRPELGCRVPLNSTARSSP